MIHVSGNCLDAETGHNFGWTEGVGGKMKTEKHNLTVSEVAQAEAGAQKWNGLNG